MIRKILSIAFFLALPLASIFAQQKPDFSGTWKLDVAKSDFGMFPAPTSRTDVITIKEPSVTDHVSSEEQQGKLDYTVNYSTDGKESTNTIGEFVIKSTAKWDGNNFVVNSKLKVNDMDITVVSTWTLSANGKALTVSAHISSTMGEADQKLTFGKQDSAADTSAKPVN